MPAGRSPPILPRLNPLTAGRIAGHKPLVLPYKLAALLEPATTAPEGGRFLVIYGGRGSAKTQSIAEAI